MPALRAVLAAALVAAAAGADDEPPYDWRAEAAKAGLSADETARLAESKLLVAGPEFRQSFEPYIKSSVPTFVTSDSVLNAYHVLLEECVVRLERARAAQLPGLLRTMWDGVPAAAKRLDTPAPDLRRAQVAVGTALRLVGGETPGASDEVLALVATEVERVRRGEERILPPWLAAPTPGLPFLDYGRFRPRGFYARDEILAAHFRATAFLQDVPLRIRDDGEMRTALVLAEALGKGDAYAKYVATWESFLGNRGDLPLSTTSEGLLQRWRERNGGGEDPLHGVEPSVRVLPAITLPDGQLLDRCSPSSPTPAYPTGLFVAAALGGEFARKQMPSPAEAMRGGLGGGGTDVYALYLRALAALLDAPEPAAPAPFRGDAWQAKSTNTALAGWAQMRHTWVLQARESRDLGSAEWVRAGFVEPDPVFFRRLAHCARATRSLFETAGAFDKRLDRRELLLALRDYALFLRAGGGARTKRVLSDDEERIEGFGSYFVQDFGGPPPRHYEALMSEADVAAALRITDDAVKKLEGDDALPRELTRWVQGATRPFRETWTDIESLCRSLEAMATKQLAGEEWEEDEKELLLEYGHVLAKAMLYEGNSYMTPPDDAPRATSVYAWLGGEPTGYFHAAVARPRSLFVLYPWKGGEILCRGSVLPYREFVAGKRLTDAEWRALLDSEDAPAPPPWFVPIASSPPRSK